MSAEEMRRLTVKRLSKLRDDGVSNLRRVRYERPAIVKVGDSTVTAPGSSIESIGVLHCEINAEIIALEKAIEIVNETYRVLTSPKPEKSDEGDEKQEEYY